MKATAEGEGRSKLPSKLYDLGKWAAPTGAKSIREFEVLTQELTSASDRSWINGKLAGLTPSQSAEIHAVRLGFTTTTLDPHGRVVLLSWKGIEAALLFKRAVTKVSILPKEQLPPKILSREDEAWMMLPLMQTAYHSDAQQLRQSFAVQGTELQEAKALLRHQQIELDAMERQLLSWEVKYNRLRQRRAAAKAKKAPTTSKPLAKAKATTTARRSRKCAASKPM